MVCMRDLTADDFGVLLSVFAVLLLAFGADFHFSRRMAKRHKLSARLFMTVNVVGELATAIALVLTWVALWSPAAWERIDDLLVFVPGCIAMLCVVTLAVETVVTRTMDVWRG